MGVPIEWMNSNIICLGVQDPQKGVTMKATRMYWNNEDYRKWSIITGIIARMMKSEDDTEVFDLYCEAEDLWEEYFPYESLHEGDSWYGCRMFNIRQKQLEKLSKIGITYNLYGCKVTIVNE